MRRTGERQASRASLTAPDRRRFGCDCAAALARGFSFGSQGREHRDVVHMRKEKHMPSTGAREDIDVFPGSRSRLGYWFVEPPRASGDLFERLGESAEDLVDVPPLDDQRRCEPDHLLVRVFGEHAAFGEALAIGPGGSGRGRDLDADE